MWKKTQNELDHVTCSGRYNNPNPTDSRSDSESESRIKEIGNKIIITDSAYCIKVEDSSNEVQMVTAYSDRITVSSSV